MFARPEARAAAACASASRTIPGVARVETRVVVDVTLDVPGLDEPASGRLIGIPVPTPPTLNDVFLRRGRFPAAGAPDEVLVSEAFALAARPRARATASAPIINGRRRELEIVGIALSPEYIYGIRPGRADAGRLALRRVLDATAGASPRRSTWRAASTTWR